MSASWPCSISDLPSVNGIVKTSGSVPPASWAANVGPVHSYSCGSTSMSGLAASNCLDLGRRRRRRRPARCPGLKADDRDASPSLPPARSASVAVVADAAWRPAAGRAADAAAADARRLDAVGAVRVDGALSACDRSLGARMRRSQPGGRCRVGQLAVSASGRAGEQAARRCVRRQAPDRRGATRFGRRTTNDAVAAGEREHVRRRRCEPRIGPSPRSGFGAADRAAPRGRAQSIEPGRPPGPRRSAPPSRPAAAATGSASRPSG